MTGFDWAPLTRIDFAKLHEARVQAHYAVQWLARTARAFLSPSPDDSHTNLGWDDAFGGFETHKLQGARIGLKLHPLALAILEGKDPTPSRILPLEGHKDADARGWLGEELGHLGLDARKLDVMLPYKLPPHKIATGARYAVGTMSDAFRELGAWYANANRSLARVRDAVTELKLESSLVRCWPHHFDIATLITLDKTSATIESARSVGVGLSPGDEHIDEPYFYVTPWPYPPLSRLPPLPEIGRWHTQNFTAAVLPARRILSAEGRQTRTEEFLTAAVEACLKVLGPLR